MTTISKETLLNALRAFVAQRPGLEPANYGSVSGYRSELRGITRDRHHAEALIGAVAWRDSITAEQIIEAAKHAYSGRLSITEDEKGCYTLDGYKFRPGRVRIDYCTGQYFPTEYRRAVCAVLSSVLWDYFRDNMPGQDESGNGTPANPPTYHGRTAGDYLRHTARRELGRTLASRWFN